MALVLWLGGIVFFGAVAAPALFRFVPAHVAGEVVTQAITNLHWIGILSGIVFIAASLVYSRLRPGKAALPRARNLLILAMIALTLVSQFGLMPTMTALRQQMGNLAALPPTDARLEEFNRLHQWSTRLETLVLGIGISVLALLAKENG